MSKNKRKTRKKSISNSAYRERFKELKKYHKFNFDGRQKLTPARKASITKQWKQLEPIVKEFGNEDTSLKFVEFTKGTKAKLSKAFDSEVKTNKGAFMRVPEVKGAGKIKPALDSQGNITYKVGSQVRTLVVIPDRINLLKKPEDEVQKILKKYPQTETMSFAVNGRPTKSNFSANPATIENNMIYQYRGTVIRKRIREGEAVDKKVGLWDDEALEESLVTSFILFWHEDDENKPVKKKAKKKVTKKKTAKKRTNEKRRN